MSERESTNPRRILIVEDAENWAELLEKELKKIGVITVVASTPEEANELLEQGGFTQIITDGLEGHWPEIAASAAGIPVTLLSNSNKQIESASEAGIPAFDKLDITFGRKNVEDLLQS